LSLFDLAKCRSEGYLRPSGSKTVSRQVMVNNSARPAAADA
jgi:hypothetical protein